MRLATVTLVVDDYDRAITWFSDALGFDLLEDSDLGGGKRWVLMAPPGGGARILLARAAIDIERSAIGTQTGGRVGFFLETSNFTRDHARMMSNGVEFLENPRRESYATVAVFQDLCGNGWDLIELATAV